MLCTLWTVISFSICLKCPHGICSSLSLLPALSCSLAKSAFSCCAMQEPWTPSIANIWVQHQGMKVGKQDKSRVGGSVLLLVPAAASWCLCCLDFIPGLSCCPALLGGSNAVGATLSGSMEKTQLGSSTYRKVRAMGKWTMTPGVLCSSEFSFSHSCRHNICLFFFFFPLANSKTEKQTKIGYLPVSHFNQIPFSNGRIFNS